MKAHALAKEFGLVPEGAWKWGLRNLRKGKTPQQLGMAPQKMVDASRRLGDKVEAGALWGKGAKGSPSQIGKGGAGGFDFAGVGKNLVRNKKFITNAMGAGDASPKKQLAKATQEYIETHRPYRKMNSLHTHPEESTREGLKMEKGMIGGLSDANAEEQYKMMESLRDDMPDMGMQVPDKAKFIEGVRNIRAVLEKRHGSAHPGLMPSGMALRQPYHRNAQDLGAFHLHDIGTHHNIVQPGTGVGIHTVRPDKSGNSPTGKRLRSLLFRENT